jgi:phenylpropionate dioxygenase-like ring-hydroxylating dioxygenase large terminal subunit
MNTMNTTNTTRDTLGQSKLRGIPPDGYLHNCWYQAAWASELAAGPLARTLLDIPLILFNVGSRVAALHDRCPHRFAPLSAGVVRDGAISCGYHGLTFDGSGHCVRNPHGAVTSAMRTASFPVAERHTAIWVWMGEANRADPGLIPDLSFIDETPETARIEFHMPTAAGYRLLTDNIMDLSHADFLHPQSLGGVITEAKSRVFKRGRGLVGEWTNLGCQAPGMFQAKIPSPQKADYWIEVEWSAPAVMKLGTAVVPANQPRAWQDEIYALHNMTPETARSTHYFMCATRRERVDDVHYSEMLKGALAHAFLGEDKPMVEAQQARMGDADLWSLNPVLMRVDAAAVQVRRELDKMIAAEQGHGALTGSGSELEPTEHLDRGS